MARRLIVHNLLWFAAMGLLLFLPAGTLDWPAAWAFLAELAILGLAMGLWLLRLDPGLVEQRLGAPIQKGQPVADKILLSVFLLLFAGWLVLMGLDAVRFGWSSMPGWAQGAGALGIFLSLWIGYRVMRENSFAAPVVRIQEERGQTVVTTGPYRYVRHPLYAGALFFFIGSPLLLGSWWGLVPALLLALMLALRIPIEERALRAGLPGYAAYAARVRYRLIPLVW
jgi:protein-S-isoprenylcysteine O-methyltransferase Ste14